MAAQDPQVVEPQEFIPILDYTFTGNNATLENKQKFIAALVETRSVYHAAQHAGINRVTAYRWRDADSDFAKAWEDALEDATDVLEESMYQRARGKDTLAGIFLLKAYRPQFRDKVTVDLAVVAGEIEERIGQAVANRTLLPAASDLAISPPTTTSPKETAGDD